MDVIDFPLPCRFCGGSLLGQPLISRCPSCGHSVGMTLARKVLDPQTLTICRDTPCAGCQYNLRTLPLGGKCPECGRPVVESLHPGDLYLADYAWLRKIRRGVKWWWGWLVGVFVMMVSLVGLHGIFRDSIAIPFWILVAEALGICWLIGVFYLSAREPGSEWFQPGDWSHRWSRFSALGFLLFINATLGTMLYASLPPFSGQGVFLVSFISGSFICYLLNVISVLTCFRRLADRGRYRGLSVMVRVQCWLSIVSLCLLAVLLFSVILRELRLGLPYLVFSDWVNTLSSCSFVLLLLSSGILSCLILSGILTMVNQALRSSPDRMNKQEIKVPDSIKTSDRRRGIRFLYR